MTTEELNAARFRLANLETAYDKLITGEQSAEVRYGEFSEKYHAADATRLERTIASLRDSIARAEGSSAGGVVIGF